jgi:hypothetical protein
MGRFHGPLSVLLAALLSCRAVQAQQPPLAAPCESTSLQTPPCVCPPPPVAGPAPYCCTPAPAFDGVPLFAVELMLGQELGLRGQVVPYSDRYGALVVEGFYGGLFTDIGSAQALGAGGRWLWTDSLGTGDSLVFGPGVDVFFGLNHRALILLTPSVDLGWMLKLGPSLEWEIGLEVGLGIGVSGHTDHGHSAVGDFTQLISLYTGLRF